MRNHLPKVTHIVRKPGTLWSDSSDHWCLGDRDRLGLGGRGATAVDPLINDHNQGYLPSINHKVMTNLESIFKSRDITLPTNVPLVKAMVFPVVMYGCESWTIWKLSTKELMLLNYGVGEDSWESLGVQRSNQSILKEINPGYSLEGLMMKLKLQYFGHVMWRADSLEKPLMLGKIEGRRRRGWQRMR